MDRRKLLLESLMVIARQPDQGANLSQAGRKIEEHITGLDKDARNFLFR
jgi:hypothetical protein